MIINNVRRLNETFKGNLVFRLPFIPGYNSSRENLTGIASLISETNWKVINILPLHHLGRDKYQLIDKPYQGADFQIPSSGDLETAKAIFESSGISCFIGDETPF